MNPQAPPFLTRKTTCSPDASPPTQSPTPTPPVPEPSPSETPVSDDALPQKQPQVVRILRREHKKPNNHRSALSDNDSLDPSDQRKNMTIEERELAYGLARARIFAEEAASEPPRSNSSSPKPLENSSGDNKLEASPSSSSSSSSASSSTSGPAKTVVNGIPKHKNPSKPTQPNGDTATGRAPRVTHKPKPQFRPPASANFAVGYAQMFGYPGFVPTPDAYAEQQQGRGKYANNPSNFYPTSTTFNGRPPPSSFVYNQNNQMAYANGNFLMPGVPHATTPYYPMDGHQGPYIPETQLMSSYSGNGFYFNPMQSQQQSYPPLLQYPNVASSYGPTYRPASGGYDWPSSYPNMVISPYGPAPGNSGGMTGVTAGGRYDGAGIGSTSGPSVASSTTDPSSTGTFFGGAQMHNNHYLNHQDNSTQQNSYHSKQQQQQRPQLHQQHIHDYPDLQPHHQSQAVASPNLYSSMYPPLPQAQQTRPDLQPTRQVQMGCWGQQMHSVPSASSPAPSRPTSVSSSYPANSTVAKQSNAPQLHLYNSNSTNPPPPPSSLTGNTQIAGGGNGIGSNRHKPISSSSSNSFSTASTSTTPVPKPGLPNRGMSSGYPIPKPPSSSPANIPSSSLPQAPYR